LEVLGNWMRANHETVSDRRGSLEKICTRPRRNQKMGGCMFLGELKLRQMQVQQPIERFHKVSPQIE
jgi:hypothetical protein